MTPRRCVTYVMLPLLACLPPGHAAQPASAAPKAEKDPDSGLALDGIVRRLSDTMTGRPVIAVRPTEWDERWNAADFAHARTDIEKLQVVAAAFSSEDVPLLPFKVGSAYVIAPQSRGQMIPDLASITPWDVASRGMLLADVLTSLKPEQMKDLGSEEGLAVSVLPPEMRREVARPFRPPLEITSLYPDTVNEDTGLKYVVYRSKSDGALREPLDWTTEHIRARLRMTGVVTDSGPGTGDISQFSTAPRFEESDDAQPPEPDGVKVSIYTTVPNTFKPSDLDGKTFTEPLGLSGAWTVEQVVEHLAKATGLSLSVWKPYRNAPVFLGAKSLRIGDVMDGLRLALTASWRKMGDGYSLVWDRTPLLAIQQIGLEATDAVTEDILKQRDRITESEAYVQLARTIPFASDDPMAPDDAQRARIFGPAKPDDPLEAGLMGISFAEMSPAQQNAIRERAAKSVIHYADEQGNYKARAYTEEDFQSARLYPLAVLEVSVQVPGRGWVTLESDDMALQPSRYRLNKAARKNAPPDAPKGDVLAHTRKPLRDAITDPKPVTLPADVRGLVVPTLTPARLNTLAGEMKEHGLNVLFYPGLFEGYSTVGGASFPPAPDLDGSDGLAAAVAAMKPKGIRVVAYVDALAWKEHAGSSHWLDQHPDWLDVDVLGRGRLAWLKAHPDGHWSTIMGRGGDARDYVRATAPEVEARLKALVRVIAAHKDISAIAFAGWRPSWPVTDSRAGKGLQPPALGYAMADRLAAFRKTGDDPADAVESHAFLPIPSWSLYGSMVRTGPGTDVPRMALVSRLIHEAKAARKDWRVYEMNLTGWPDDTDGDKPRATARKADTPDLRISNAFAPNRAALFTSGIMFPIGGATMGEMPRAMEQLVPDELQDALGKTSPLVYYDTMLSDIPASIAHFPMALYDFRTAPDAITESLGWVKLPNPPVSATRTSVRPRL